MDRRFPLAGLLRVREIERDRAAGELGAAQRAKADAVQQVMRVREALFGPWAPVSADALVWQELIAARAALTALLDQQNTALRAASEVVRQREEAWFSTRARTRVVENLADRHALRVVQEEALAEQQVIDELASTRTRTDGDWLAAREGA